MTPKAEHADLVMKSDHAVLLNTLNRMSEAPLYALRRQTLIQAESLIFEQEREIKALRVECDRLESRLKFAWEEGFKLCRRYGDNHAHFDGMQKQRHWELFLRKLSAPKVCKECGGKGWINAADGNARQCDCVLVEP